MDLPTPPAAAAAAAATRRLFVGLQPGAPTRAAIAAWRDGWSWPAQPRPSLVPADHLHLTLFFLGEVGADAESCVRAALAATPMPPLRLRLRTPAVWRNGVAVLLPDEQPLLLGWRERLRHALLARGIAAAHGPDWRPHLTLARKAGQARPPAQAADFDLALRESVLVWSQLPPLVERARYVVLARYPATAGAAAAQPGGHGAWPPAGAAPSDMP